MSLQNLLKSNDYELNCSELTVGEINTHLITTDEIDLFDETNSVILKPYNFNDLSISGGISATGIIFDTDQTNLTYYNQSANKGIAFINGSFEYDAALTCIRIGNYVNIRIVLSNGQIVLDAPTSVISTAPGAVDPEYVPFFESYFTISARNTDDNALFPLLGNVTPDGSIVIISCTTGIIPMGGYAFPSINTGYIH